MVTLSSRAITGKWFDKRRGAVTAWSSAVVAFMFSGAPIAFEYLIRLIGWQGAWRWSGYFGVGVLVAYLHLCIRDFLGGTIRARYRVCL